MKFKIANWRRGLACMLVLFSLLTFFAVAEPMSGTGAATEYVAAESVDMEQVEEIVAHQQERLTDQEINVLDGLKNIFMSTGLAKGEWRQYVMLVVACALLYLAIVRQFEPLLLLPIAFGMLLANLPAAGMMAHPSYTYYGTLQEAAVGAKALGKDLSDVLWRFNEATGTMQYSLQTTNGGLLYYLYHGVKLGIFPPIIFMGVGAMTDFTPLIANPKSLLLGAAAQLGIFLTFIGAKLMNFSATEAGSIGIIGGADGPTAIFVTTKLAPHLLGPIAVAAYSYMALVPVIQPPIMRALTTKKERSIRMKQLRTVSRTEVIIFPIMVTLIVSLLLPDAATLIGMLMLGNLLRVCGVTERLNKTAQNELCNIVTIFLGLTVGATTNGETFLKPETLYIVLLGVLAFSCGTAGGVLLAKLMNKLSGGTINPLIGSAGVSAVPMAARVSQKVGQEEDPGNFLLMHAMGPNVAGVIGSAVAAGVFIALFA
ncbi:MAG: sodium ion-translocating decarboxylase subunit beta [Christensenellales bacterium]|nr:sodium ion-translocating decarboxylase subunit beta [Christensenellales bacterium]